MKSIIIIIGLTLIVNLLFGQDTILKRNGYEIKVKLIEISQNEVKYKKFDYLDGPIYNISKAEVFMIKYENGTKAVFNEPVKLPETNAGANNDDEADKMNRYYMQKKKPGTAIGYSLIPFAGPIVAQSYAKKNIDLGILLCAGEIVSVILMGAGQHDETVPVSSFSNITYTTTVYEPIYYLGWVGYLGMVCISSFSSANDVKIYNKNLYNKIYNDSNTGLGFQIVPANKGLLARLVYKF